VPLFCEIHSGAIQVNDNNDVWRSQTNASCTIQHTIQHMSEFFVESLTYLFTQPTTGNFVHDSHTTLASRELTWRDSTVSLPLAVFSFQLLPDLSILINNPGANSPSLPHFCQSCPIFHIPIENYFSTRHAIETICADILSWNVALYDLFLRQTPVFWRMKCNLSSSFLESFEILRPFLIVV
jgi:hypothetical protein